MITLFICPKCGKELDVRASREKFKFICCGDEIEYTFEEAQEIISKSFLEYK